MPRMTRKRPDPTLREYWLAQRAVFFVTASSYDLSIVKSN